MLALALWTVRELQTSRMIPSSLQPIRETNRKGIKTMKFEDYLKNPKLAVATEIYNAKCNSPEEMMELMDAINNERDQFEGDIRKFNICLHNISYCTGRIETWETAFNKRKEFKESHIGKLIEFFISNNNEDAFKAIETEIEASGNPFEVSFREGEDSMRARGVKGEIFGVPASDYFHVGYTQTFYRINYYDIDSDIAYAKKQMDMWQTELQACLDEKHIMCGLHDIEAINLLEEKFNHNDPFKWSDFINDSDYYGIDYEEDYNEYED